jgi:hypothetical protein
MISVVPKGRRQVTSVMSRVLFAVIVPDAATEGKKLASKSIHKGLIIVMQQSAKANNMVRLDAGPIQCKVLHLKSVFVKASTLQFGLIVAVHTKIEDFR